VIIYDELLHVVCCNVCVERCARLMGPMTQVDALGKAARKRALVLINPVSESDCTYAFRTAAQWNEQRSVATRSQCAHRRTVARMARMARAPKVDVQTCAQLRRC
jgi:hypothetical protein